MKRWTLQDFNKLSIEEKILKVAEASLALYGTLVPPMEALIPMMDKRCPKCGKIAPILQDFGVRTVKDGIRAQGWCLDCRNLFRTDPEVSRVLDGLPESVLQKMSAADRQAIVEAIIRPPVKKPAKNGEKAKAGKGGDGE